MSGQPIALDGFGTDARPAPEIDAAIRSAGAGVRVDLVGDQARLGEALEQRLDELDARAHADAISIIHAAEQIGMDESPARAVRAKPDASLCVAMNRVRSGEAAAVVSAGNSGAILAAALFRLGRIRGIDRPAIVANLPQVDGSHDAVMIDAGANTECSVLNLVQFAVLGAIWSRHWHGVARPRVGVLANGQEAGKGTALTRGAHKLLADHAVERGADSMFEFVGHVEPNRLFFGACDVVVTDGWTGNVALKLAEGAMVAWPQMLARAIAAQHGAASITGAIEPALRELERRFDPEAHGGAPLLGVDGAVIICHGASGPRALHSALLMARRFAERGLIDAIARTIADHRELFELARTLR
ncbi:MAG TPA: phosphate acyltransferase PlsX [Enhygromyxa sp.]|nr:phosphate acyltransferase PlsX [Enhygromyxa sp.]